jgi:hypothetical protein
VGKGRKARAATEEGREAPATALSPARAGVEEGRGAPMVALA